MVNNIYQFIKSLPHNFDFTYNTVFYRGINSKHDLTPSIYRKNNEYKEHIIYKEVSTKCFSDFSECGNSFEKLSKMQHYGMPTRLLDITSDPLVALYFACIGENNIDKNAVVYVFSFPNKDIKTFDSYSANLLALLPLIEKKEKIKLASLAKELQLKTDLSFNQKNKIITESPIGSKLLRIGRKQSSLTITGINHYTLLNNFCVLPRWNHSRIEKQKGAFIIYGLNDDFSNEQDFVKQEIIISAKDKQKILKQLNIIGINSLSLYHDLYKNIEYYKNLNDL